MDQKTMTTSRRVFVLIFNPRTDNEGIHSIQIGDRNWILMFESEDDATRYAMLLEAQDFLSPSVEAIDAAEIEEFCEGAGYECKLIPEGFVPEGDAERLFLVPPETNLEETDWKPDAPQPEVSDLDRIRRQLEGLL
jgi:hypothetical protein